MKNASRLTQSPGFCASSAMAARIRAHDWAATPFRALEEWPHTLRLMLNVCQSSPLPSAIYWGAELRMLFNDAWVALHGHEHELGCPAPFVWAKTWAETAPHLRRLMEYGAEETSFERRHTVPHDGGTRETLWHYSVTPILDESGSVAGLFEQGHEVRSPALYEHRHALETLNGIASATIAEKDPEKIVQLVTDAGVALTGAAFGAFFYTGVNEAGEKSHALYCFRRVAGEFRGVC